MARNRWMAAAIAAASITLAAGCAGGSSTSSLMPASQPAESTQSAPRISATSAPSDRISAIEASAKARDSVGGVVQDPLANWQFLEPLSVDDASATFSVPSWVTECTPISPLLGVWYVSLKNFSVPLSQVSLPVCTEATPAPHSGLFVAKHSDNSIQPPSGPYSNLYVVQVDVGLFSLSTTPVAGPGMTYPLSFQLPALESNLSFQKDDLYAFFLANYTGTGSPTTESI